VASTIVMMAEANTRSFDLRATSTESAKEVDPEIEAKQETDVFPGIISFAMHLYQ